MCSYGINETVKEVCIDEQKHLADKVRSVVSSNTGIVFHVVKKQECILKSAYYIKCMSKFNLPLETKEANRTVGGLFGSRPFIIPI